MKKWAILITMLSTLGLGAQTYSPNDGNTPPGTFNSKDTMDSGSESQVPAKKFYKKTTTTTSTSDVQAEEAAPGTSETGIQNSSGVTTEQMNTSPNSPPSSDQQVIEDATLSTGRFDPTKPGEIQAQDEKEDALDYSTTPQKETSKPGQPLKK